MSIGYKSVLAENPALYFPQCFIKEQRPYIKIFPKVIDPYICATYEAIQQLPTSPAADALIGQLVRFGVTFVSIVTFEGGRQSSFWLKQSELYLLIAQATSGAAAIPAYFAAIHARHTRSDTKPLRSSPQDAWASLISTTVGYLLPVYYGSQTAWQGDALILFLLYPVFIWMVKQSTRRIFEPFVENQSIRLPILIQGLVGVAISARSHSSLYRDFTLKQLFQPSLGLGLVEDMHGMLLADFAITATALASHVVLYSYRHESTRVKAGIAAGIVILGIFIGPGGAISAAWALGEGYFRDAGTVSWNQRDTVDKKIT